MHEDGVGIPRSDSKAIKWYVRANRGEDKNAKMYMEGVKGWSLVLFALMKLGLRNEKS